ncbi:MAG: hemolysin D [Pseudopedobacter saltans]|uniref:Hemolysin D n=1 Tax=Pseudopedobacter saltans TaxID=151895 RepID=A0A2W5H1J0_9SPHI|nr:MAG: hemolysin D [Pseudopedobacter saltans]
MEMRMKEEPHENYEKYFDQRKTEEVQDIIDRMPTQFGLWITGIVVLIFILLLFFGWIIRYPDIITGQITVNTNISPLKLVAMNSGKLKLKISKSQNEVKEGEVIAYIENTTSLGSLESIKSSIENYNPLGANKTYVLQQLPQRVDLGEVTNKYYAFLESVQLLKNFEDDKQYEKQISGLKKLLIEQSRSVDVNNERMNIAKRNMLYTGKFYSRDSILFKEKVISEAELDQSQLNYLNSNENYQNIYTGQINALQNVKQTQTQIGQSELQMLEKKKELELALMSSYNDLKDNIKLWGQSYSFTAPFNGTVQFLKFWTDGQFIQNGQPVFTIIPNDKHIYGQVLLPSAVGAGKVRIGQEVIIKLDNYPYLEYGYIKGVVNTISLTTNTETTQQGSVDTYLVTVTFTNGLTTNYGRTLDFKQESKGSAEILVHKRRLIERFFDNLKYITKKE